MNGWHGLEWLAGGGTFSFGLLLALLGGLKKPLAEQFAVEEERTAGLTTSVYLTLIPLLPVAGLVIDSWGVREVLCAGFLLTALALSVVGMGHSCRFSLYGVFLAGAGGAAILTGSGVLLPLAFFKNDPAAAANLGFVFAGLGSLLAPLLLTLLARAFGLRRGLGVLAALFLLPALAAATLPGEALPAHRAFEPGFILDQPYLWVAGLVSMIYLLLEGALGLSFPAYLRELHYPERRIRLATAGFWLVFLGARLLTAFLQQRDHLSPYFDPWLILCLTVLAVVALGNLAGTHSPAGAAGMMLAVGVCLGPVFPTLLGTVLKNFAPSEYGTVLGVVFALGMAGNLVLSPLYSRRAEKGPSQRRLLRVLTAVGLLLVLASMAFALTGA